MEALAESEGKPAVWWATPIECQSAIFRRHRLAPFPMPLLEEAVAKLTRLLGDAHFVAATDELRERARRLVAIHPLRAADALQLAAALVWSEERPAGQSFVCLDDRLREAALREGFRVLPAV